MADHEIVENRHPVASSDEDRAATLEALNAGLEESGIGRRPLVRNSLLGAVGLVGVTAIVLLWDLGPTNAKVTKDAALPGRGSRAHHLGGGHARRPRRRRHPDPPE